jgi:hypothetical protein
VICGRRRATGSAVPPQIGADDGEAPLDQLRGDTVPVAPRSGVLEELAAQLGEGLGDEPGDVHLRDAEQVRYLGL